MSKRPNPLSAEPGYITSRKNPDTGESLVLYDGSVAGFKNEKKWVCVCALHGTIISESNQRRARALLRSPSLWCECCRSISDPTPILHIVPFQQKTPDDQEREMRVMAQKTKDNPEKVELFEKVYGVSPKAFWN